MVDKELLREAYQYAMQHPLLTIGDVACKYNLCRSTFARYCASITPAITAEERLRAKHVAKKKAREATYKEAYAYALQHPEVSLDNVARLHGVGVGNFSQYYREHASPEAQQQRRNTRGVKIRQSVISNAKEYHAAKGVAPYPRGGRARCSEEEQERSIAEAHRLEWVHGVIQRRIQWVREQRRNAAAENRERLIHEQDIKER